MEPSPLSQLPVSVGSNLRAALADLPVLHPTAARLFLVRHGESEANSHGQLCGGGSDSELNANGQAQVETLAAELVGLNLKLNVVASSSLRRATASADAIARRLPHAERLTLAECREMCYGRLEGASIAKVGREIGALAKRWRAGETDLPVADGESPEAVLSRVLPSLCALLRCRSGQSVVLVCHAHVNKVLIASAVSGLGLLRCC